MLTQEDAGLEIARTLGGLPLALELAGAYLRLRTMVGFQRYLELLNHDLKQALPKRFASLTQHEADRYSTLRISAGVFAEEPQLSQGRLRYARQLLGADHPDTLSTARLLKQIKRPGFRVPPSKKAGTGGKRGKPRR